MINYKLEKTLFELFYFFIIEFWFVLHSVPWFERGGILTNGTGSGVFVFAHGHGDTYVSDSFRVLSYTKIKKDYNNIAFLLYRILIS